MSHLYQRLDAPHFDYQLAGVPGAGDWLFRGPVPDLQQPYAAVVGGAQAFGRFVPRPFAHRLAAEIGLPCLNLGTGGAGPRFALRPEILPLLQRARLVVVQMFSGRSASNALFDNTWAGRNTGRLVATGELLSFEAFLERLLRREDRALLQRTVLETRDDYSVTMLQLARRLGVPAVLLWWSRRHPDYEPDWESSFGITGEFPQLIDRAVVDRIRPGFAAYVECVSAAGLPQRLWQADAAVEGTRRGDDGWLWNDYYPSPEMHELAAARLRAPCRRLLGLMP